MPAEGAIKMLAVLRKQGDEAKIFEGEARPDRAPNERVCTLGASGLPDAGGDDRDVGRLVGVGQQCADQLPGVRRVGEQLERVTTIEVPDLVGVDHVPAAELTGGEEIVDGGECRAT